MPNKTKTTHPFRDGINTVKDQPAAGLAAIQKLDSELERITQKPLVDNLEEVITARIRLAEVRNLQAEYLEWDLGNRSLTAVQNYIEENTLGIVDVLNETISQRASKMPGVFASHGKKLAALAVEAFAPSEAREENRRQREAVEDKVDFVEAAIQTAKTSVRYFELNPSLQTFNEAEARVNEILIP